MAWDNTKAFRIAVALAACAAFSSPALAETPGLVRIQARQGAGEFSPSNLNPQQKAGCGAALMMLGGIASQYPQLFGGGANARNAQVMMQTLGVSGRVMLAEAFQSGAASGVKPEKVFEDGIGALMANATPVPGESSEAAGRRIGLGLLKGCTGLEVD